MDPAAGARGMELVLLHEINSGTFARLYLAETRGSSGLDRIVAVKILREQWGEQPDIVNRTRDEARLLARLRHKNILRVEDLVEVDGQTAIIMEYVDGLDLKQLVDGMRDQRQRLPAKVALHIALYAASALEAAYFRVPTGLEQPLRVIHRDVKPSNIMVSTEGEVRVLDFGTARSSHILRSAQTGAMRFGSLKYMSPERREGDRGEHAGDVYALGLVLLELLRTEWLPLLPLDTDEHDRAIAQAIAQLDQLAMPNSEWDSTLRRVLGQMLSSDPAARPSADQVVKLLHAFVEQANGPMLDRFAAETVQPLADRTRPKKGGGALAGRSLMVTALPDTPRGSDPRSAPRGEPTRSTPSRPAAQAVEPVDGGSGSTMVAVGAGVVVVGGVGLLLAAAIGTAILWRASGPPEAALEAGGTAPNATVEVAATGSSVPVEVPAGGEANTGEPVSVVVSGEPAQWVRLEREGATSADGRGALSARVPEGDYALAIKIVGRSAVRAPVSVPVGGLSLNCDPDTRASLRCTGGKRAILLKP